MTLQDCQSLNIFFNNTLNENCCNNSYNSNELKITCDNDSIISLELDGYTGYLDFEKFPELSKIKSIKFNNIRIVDLPNNFFIIPNLSELYVTNAALKHINTYENYIISKLILTNNDFSEIDNSFSLLKGLRELNLSNNLQIRSFDTAYLPKKLISLDLSETGLEYLPYDIQNLNNLESLNLRKTCLKEIRQNLFKFKYLKYFDISDNPDLKAKIYHFGSKVDRCYFNNTNITCYQEGTCNFIDQNIKYDKCSDEYILQLQESENNKGFNILDDASILLIFFIVIIIFSILIITCVTRKLKRNPPSYSNTIRNPNHSNYNYYLYSNNDNLNSNILPHYSEFANYTEEVLAVGDNIPLNNILNTNNGTSNHSTNSNETNNPVLPPSYNEVVG